VFFARRVYETVTTMNATTATSQGDPLKQFFKKMSARPRHDGSVPPALVLYVYHSRDTYNNNSMYCNRFVRSVSQTNPSSVSRFFRTRPRRRGYVKTHRTNVSDLHITNNKKKKKPLALTSCRLLTQGHVHCTRARVFSIFEHAVRVQ